MGRAVLLLLLVLIAVPPAQGQEGGAAPPAAPAAPAEGETPAPAAARLETPSPAPQGAAGGGEVTYLYGVSALGAHLKDTLDNDPAFAQAVADYYARRWEAAARGFAAQGAGGNMWARLFLGEMYAYGRGLPPNNEAAVEWLRPAAIAGLSPAQLAMGEVLERPGPMQDVTAAAVFYRFAAPDLPRARYRLALLFLAGHGVPARPDLAAGLAHSAAQSGLPEAMLLLAHLLGEGVGVQPDRPEAVRWLQRAAWMATPRDTPLPTLPQELLAWTRAAAADGNVAAQLALGIILARGIGTPARPEEGAFWLEQAGLRYRAMESAHGTALALLELTLVRPGSPVIPRMADRVMPAGAAAPEGAPDAAAPDMEILDEEVPADSEPPADEEVLDEEAGVPAPGVGEAP